jgi:hypothetical protein
METKKIDPTEEEFQVCLPTPIDGWPAEEKED